MTNNQDKGEATMENQAGTLPGRRGMSVFDFDGTLTRHDTLFQFARHAVGKHGLRRAFLRSLPAILSWKLGLRSNSEAKETLFGHLYRGMPLSEFEEHGRTFADVVDQDLRPAGMALLEEARKRGDRLVIDSASMGQWIQPWAERHGFDDVIATMPEVDARGRLTGRFATPNCYGTEKVTRLREVFPDRDRWHITAHGDSSGDSALLDYADTPHLLRKHSLRDRLIIAAFLLVSLMLVLAAILAYNRYITTPPYVSEELYPVRGIDVSAHNGMMNLDAAAAAGMEFVFIKATEGRDFRDANFALNYLKAGHAGMKRGAYHFFRFDSDGIAQAVNLLKALRGRPLELGVAIDIEEHGNPTGIPADSITARLRDMVDFLILNGHRVTFYSNSDGLHKYVLPDYRGFPTWICSFNESTEQSDFTYWQYNHRGSVPGIRGDVDLNAFGGSREQWEKHLAEYARENQRK